MTARLSLPWLVLLLAFTASQAAHVRASSFSVNPVQLFLSSTAPSRILMLHNTSDQVLRFQLTAVAWGQSAQGEMELAPTKDIVFFPSLLTLEPNASRNIRVGTATTFAPVEKTYRLFVEQLPPLDRSQTSRDGIAVLTRMGIPVFLQPEKPVTRASLDGLQVSGGAAAFRLHNRGTAHFVPRRIGLRLLDAAGNTIVEHTEKAWYVLAGGVREYRVPLSPEHCGLAHTAVAAVQVGATEVTGQVMLAPLACATPDRDVAGR